MARRICALLFVLGLATTTAAQVYSDPPAPRRPFSAGIAAANDRTDAVARLTRGALRVWTLVSDLPAWLSGQRGDGRSWADQMKAAIHDLRLSLAAAFHRAWGAVPTQRASWQRTRAARDDWAVFPRGRRDGPRAS